MVRGQFQQTDKPRRHIRMNFHLAPHSYFPPALTPTREWRGRIAKLIYCQLYYYTLHYATGIMTRVL